MVFIRIVFTYVIHKIVLYNMMALLIFKKHADYNMSVLQFMMNSLFEQCWGTEECSPYSNKNPLKIHLPACQYNKY